MPKGKKFDAAEKHFMKQKDSLDRTIKALQKDLQDMTEDRNRISRSYERELKENELLKERIQALEAVLKETQGLSESDIRTLVKKAEAVATVAGGLTAMSRLGGGLYG